MPRQGRRDQVLGILRRSRVALDDDQIAQAAEMNRVYVNVICRQLAADGLIARSQGAEGKLVNVAVAGDLGTSAASVADETAGPRARRRVAGRLAERVEVLIASFADCVAAFEASEAFPGLSPDLHLRAIERRRKHQTAGSLLDDQLFLEYAYAVLPAWGMHRMGAQAAKVGDFGLRSSPLEEEPALQQLWPLRITKLSRRPPARSHQPLGTLSPYIKVSTSRTQIESRKHDARPSAARPYPADRPPVHIQLLPPARRWWPATGLPSSTGTRSWQPSGRDAKSRSMT